MSNELAKEGLRVHTIEGLNNVDVIVGHSYQAICGVVWNPTITDLKELKAIPWCYQCVDERAVLALVDFNTYTKALEDYDRIHKDS